MNWKISLRTALLAGCAIAGCCAAGGATAQQPAAAPRAGAAEASTIAEVIVTAQRRSERLENVPMSVTAVSSETIQNAGVSNIHDLGQIVAGAQVNFAGCCTQPAIRGISTLTTGVGFENNVAIYIDGFYAPDNITVNADLANIESIEVLKGPQGTLWGRNATGGAILINTRAPSKTLTGNVEAGYGRYSDVVTSAYVSGPINDRMRYSIAGYHRSSDGYNKWLKPNGEVGDLTPLEQDSLRTKLEVDVTQKLTATLAYNYGYSSDGRGNVYQPFQHVNPVLPPPPARSITPYEVTAEVPSQASGMVQEGTAKLALQTPIGTLTSYTGFAYRTQKLAYDFDGSFVSLVRAYGKDQQNTFQQTVDYNITAIPKTDLVVGGSYYFDRWKQPISLAISGGQALSDTRWSLRTESFAFYADATYHLTDRVALNLGGRYSHDDKSVSNYVIRLVPPPATVINPFAGDASFHAFTPRASIRYELAPRTNVYASYSQGYRSGGFNPTPGQSAPFQPEKVKTYEIGFKTAQPAWRLEAAAFYSDYRDMQVGVTVPNPAVPGSIINLIGNAKASEIYGVDSNVVIQPIDHLNVRAGVAWLHGRYTDFHNATGTGLNPVTDRDVSQVQDWTGLQMARAPKFSGNVGADYELQDVVGGRLLLAGNLAFTTKYPLSNPSVFGPLVEHSLQRKQRFIGPGHAVLNLSVTWTDPSDRYRFTVWGNNVTDQRFPITFNGNALTGDYRSWSEPATYGFRAGYSF